MRSPLLDGLSNYGQPGVERKEGRQADWNLAVDVIKQPIATSFAVEQASVARKIERSGTASHGDQGMVVG